MTEHYSLSINATISAEIKEKVKIIADRYFALTQKNIVITSGSRTSQSQAEAMYGKLAGGDKLKVYSDQKSVSEILKIYEDGI